MKHEHELKSLLTGQQFEASENKGFTLAQARACAEGYVLATDGIVVISDFQNNECYIYSGKFGQNIMSLPEYMADGNSAFEDIIFSHAEEDELIERHILELRFFNFIKELPVDDKINYSASFVLNFYKAGGNKKIRILHTMRYINFTSCGSILLGLCTYIPYTMHNHQEGIIINLLTGEVIGREKYEVNDCKMLSPRQIEILSFLSKGVSSKQIADKLNISIYTVNRHRQDILSALKVANTAAAVEIALRMNII